MVDGAALASIKLNSLYDLGDPIHRNNLLDILLLQESMQSYLKLLVVLHISLQLLTFPHTEATKTAANSLKDADEQVSAVVELEFFPFAYLLFKIVAWSLFITLSILF